MHRFSRAKQIGAVYRGDMPSRAGKEAVQSKSVGPPVHPAVRGVEMPGRAANR